jgi:hypothetical protein
MASNDFDPPITNFVEGYLVRRQTLDRLRKGHWRGAENERCARHRRSADHGALAFADLLAIRALVARSVQPGLPVACSAASRRLT